VTLLAYRFALDPTPVQERALRSNAGAARVAFNWGLARVKAVLAQRAAETTYGISGDDLTLALSWSLYSLRKDWNSVKAVVAPWWGECSKEAFNTGLDQRARAEELGRVQEGEAEGQGGRVSPVQVEAEVSPVDPVHNWCLPVLGAVGGVAADRAREAARVRSPAGGPGGDWCGAGAGRVGPVRAGPLVRGVHGRAAGRHPAGAGRPRCCVGVDLGIKTLAVLSTGQQVRNPRYLSKARRKVRRLSRTVSRRQGPHRRTGQVPSHRWRRAAASLAKAQGRVADQRKDGLHKLTTALASQFGTIVVEDLNVAGMMKNRSLARHIGDASFGEFRRQLEYKTAWRGGTVIVADRWFASSKTCSGCGAVKTKLLLAERTYACAACGLITDRDTNAARNLAEYGKQHLAASGADKSTDVEPTISPGPARQVATKRQPGTRQRSQTGTVPTQEGTAA
jgi:putative transposase